MRGNMSMHWILYHLGLQSAQPQLTKAETVKLTRLASDSETIVELGVFEGATSYHLREAMKPTGTLECIDPFFEGALGISYGFSMRKEESANQRTEKWNSSSQ